MSAVSDSIPGFRSLYWSDFTLRRSVHACGLGLMVVIGIWWAFQPATPVVSKEDAAFDAAFARYAQAGGAVLALVAGAIWIRRYLLVKKILTRGAIVPATVEEVDVFDTNRHSDSSRIRTTPTYAYYATVRYSMHGRERTARFKLLHSPSTYGLKKGGETDLMVLDAAPGTPLIRSVYLGRIGVHRG